jgi:uncharacterized protein YacL
MKLPWVSVILTISYLFRLAYLGINIAIKRREEMSHFFPFRRTLKEKPNKRMGVHGENPGYQRHH